MTVDPRLPLLPLSDGHTPLDEEHRKGLKLSYITTRGELNEAEQENILRATATRRPPSTDGLLTSRYLRELHRAMFGDVWSWAGRYRRGDTNLGCPWPEITAQVEVLVGNFAHRIALATEAPALLSVAFHHQLVSVHPFPNGNGRHSRLAAGYLAAALGGPPLQWGSGLGLATEELRARYLGALQRADAGELDELVAFAIS